MKTTIPSYRISIHGGCTFPHYPLSAVVLGDVLLVLLRVLWWRSGSSRRGVLDRCQATLDQPRLALRLFCCQTKTGSNAIRLAGRLCPIPNCGFPFRTFDDEKSLRRCVVFARTRPSFIFSIPSE